MSQGALGAAGVRRVGYGLEVGRSVRTSGEAGANCVAKRAACYFQFQFPHSVCFIPCLAKRQLMNSESLIENVRQRVSYQHPANMNELGTYALSGLCRIYNMYHAWGVEFTGNKQT